MQAPVLHGEAAMRYEAAGCAYCPSTVRACRQGEGEQRGPAFCPSKVDPDGIAAARQAYADPFHAQVARVAALVESEVFVLRHPAGEQP